MVFNPVRVERFAVVLYGGISLAIYMNGVAQELLRMVRASSTKKVGKLDPVEEVYRELPEKIQTKSFVIDPSSPAPRPAASTAWRWRRRS
jgi:hypothetical protein